MNRQHVGWGTLLLGLAAFASIGDAHATRFPDGTQCFPPAERSDSVFSGPIPENPIAGCIQPWDNSNFGQEYFIDEEAPGAQNGGLLVRAIAFKKGVTETGRHREVAGTLLYSVDGGALSEIGMESWHGGARPSHTYGAVIPTDELVGAKYVDVRVMFEHEGDRWEALSDAEGRLAPLRYHFREPTRRPVTVTFELRAKQKANVESPTCVNGGTTHRNWDGHALTNWGKGVKMTRVGPDLYRASVRFPKGSYPVVWYKFQRDICAEWESDIPNRFFVLPERKWRVRLDTARWNTPGNDDRGGWWDRWGSWPRW